MDFACLTYGYAGDSPFARELQSTAASIPTLPEFDFRVPRESRDNALTAGINIGLSGNFANACSEGTLNNGVLNWTDNALPRDQRCVKFDVLLRITSCSEIKSVTLLLSEFAVSTIVLQ